MLAGRLEKTLLPDNHMDSDDDKDDSDYVEWVGDRAWRVSVVLGRLEWYMLNR
jgi:hypothetical protein